MKSLTEIRRWATLRCEHCGHRFRWKRDPRNSYGSGDGKVFHSSCISYLIWRERAEERLEVLALVVELANISDRLVTGVVELRAESETDRVAASNRTWRVFHDLKKRQEARS